MKIITVTLNPAFDIHCFAEHFQPFSENLAEITTRAAGGKGVNISRALAANGVESTALVVLGEENAADFRKSLSAYGMQIEEILVKGRIRENITLHTDNAPETRISFAGFTADGDLLGRVRAVLEGRLDGDTVLTLTGRLPDGMALAPVKEMLIGMREAGVKTVIDSKSFGIEDLIECRPFLIKPNGEEIVAYIHHKVDSLEEAAAAAESLRARGIENVMISLGDKGAALASAEGCFIAEAPRIDVLSTIGAGDSAIGGFLAAVQQGASASDRLKSAVCYGSAACMTEGTEPPLAEDVAALLTRVQAKRI